ncbi:MAG TPA: nickel-binding protein [Arenibaculum sp.]|nr:nickel-binding protein [Arenibaculum sp.]
MSVVIVEQAFAQTISGEDLLAQDAKLRWCMDIYGVRPMIHCVSTDGLRVCCVLVAPDAEAVRSAGRRSGAVPPDRIWPATIHGPVSDVAEVARRSTRTERTLAIVERSFAQPVRFDDVQSVEDRGAWCLGLNGVGFLASWFALDRQRMICVYEAPDVEAVRKTNTRLGLPFDRAWGARVYQCGGHPPL